MFISLTMILDDTISEIIPIYNMLMLLISASIIYYIGTTTLFNKTVILNFILFIIALFVSNQLDQF